MVDAGQPVAPEVLTDEDDRCAGCSTRGHGFHKTRAAVDVKWQRGHRLEVVPVERELQRRFTTGQRGRGAQHSLARGACRIMRRVYDCWAVRAVVVCGTEAALGAVAWPKPCYRLKQWAGITRIVGKRDGGRVVPRQLDAYKRASGAGARRWRVRGVGRQRRVHPKRRRYGCHVLMRAIVLTRSIHTDAEAPLTEPRQHCGRRAAQRARAARAVGAVVVVDRARREQLGSRTQALVGGAAIRELAFESTRLREPLAANRQQCAARAWRAARRDHGSRCRVVAEGEVRPCEELLAVERDA